MALGGKATQSSTLLQGSGVTDLQFPTASKAIDGSANGVYGADQSPLDGQGTVTHTLETDTGNHWWEVDLSFPQNVGEIIVHNRTDANSNRLAGAVVTVLDNSVDRNVVYTSAALTGDTTAQTVVVDVRGQIVRIEKPGSVDALSLAEVEVIEGVSQIPATSVGGRVMQEFNFDGQADLALFELEAWEGITHRRKIRHGELPLPGATVNVFDGDNQLVGTAVSDSAGFWEVDASGASSSALRVEFGPPSGYEQTPIGNDNTSSVAFVNQGEAQINFAAGDGEEYAEDDPNIIFVCFARTVDPLTDPTIVSMSNSEGVPFRSRDHDFSSASDAGTPVGTLPQAAIQYLATIGDESATTLGMAWDRKNQRALTASYERAFTAMGDDGAGGSREAAIYAIGRNGGVSLWLDLESLLGSGIAGVDGPLDTSVPGTRTFERTPDEGQNLPGHIGLGSLAISRDNTELYAVNLFSQEVYVIPIASDGSAPTGAAQIKAFPLPSLPASTNPLPSPLPDGYVDNANGIGWDDDADGTPDRPLQAALGLGVHPVSGEVYATLTRTGPALEDLEGFIYSFDPSDTTPSASDFTLESQIPMDHATIAVLPTGNTWDTHVLHPWETLAGNTTNYPTGFALQRQNMMPWLGEVEFDQGPSGEVGMIVSTRNRYHDQLNSGNFVAGGTSYRFCNTGTESSPVWQVENNGVCNGLSSEFDTTITTVGPVSVATDPVNRFFFTSGREGNFGAGTSDILPGFAEIMLPAMDNVFNNGTSGIAWLSTGGARSRDARVIGTYAPAGFDEIAFTKSNNWGSLVAAPLRAPIEVGNYVWIDTDGDGVQDPGESGFSGVTVELRDPSGTVIATAVTNEEGGYSFINDERFATSGTGSTSSVYVAGLSSNTSGYQVCIDATQPRIASTGVAPTSSNVVSGSTAAIQAGSDARDSDGVLSGDEICGPLFDTGADGESNHSFDFGFLGVVVGDYVWADTDGDGVQDPSESGIGGVEVKLLDSLGALVATTETTTAGFYQFTSSDGLAAGTNYQICIVESQEALEGFGLVNSDQGGDDDLDSDAENTSTPGFAVINFTAPAVGGMDFSLDFGFGQVRIGDYVWSDGDGDGQQDPSEEGIEGVVVKLLNSDGSPFLQTFSEDYQDDFESGVSGSSGSTDWSESSWVLGSDVSFVTADGTSGNTSMVLRLADSDADALTSMATRVVDLTGCVSDPTISFLARESAGSGETLVLEYSEDGVAFVTLTTLDNTGNAFNAQSFTLPQSATVIRFSANPNLDGADFWEIDDLEIACSDTVAVTTTTDASGFYEFSSSANGIAPNTTYQVCIEEEQPALDGFSLVMQNQGGDDELDSDAENTSNLGFAIIVATTPAAGNEDLSFDFGFGQVRIGNFVWFDEDGDGIQGGGETGIAGVTVKLLDSSGSPVIQTFAADYQDDFESGVSGSVGATDWSGTPWVLGANVSYVTGDGGLGNSTTVLRFIDNDGNATTSTATRLVDFSDCISDPTISFVAREAAGAGETLSLEYSEDGSVFTQLANLNNTGNAYNAQSFTLPRTATVIRFVGNPNLDGGEFWEIDNLQIACSDAVEVVTTTDGTGFYEFTSADGLLPLTEYQICIDNNQAPIVDLALTEQNAGGVVNNDPSGDDSDSDASGSVTLGAAIITLTTPGVGNENLSYDFGFTEVSIGNFVWFDEDGDGLFDIGETGIDGVTVVLLDSLGQPVLNRSGQPAVKVTTGGGFYEFTAEDGVEPTGSYIISIDLSQDPLSTYSLTGQDTGGETSNDPAGDDSDSDAGDNGGLAQIVVTAPTGGNENQSYDFGFARVQIGNFVWNDINGDGMQDPSEPGIEGVEVKLLDDLGNLVTVDVGVDYGDDFESGGLSGSIGITDWSATPWVANGAAIFDDSGATGGSGNAIQIQSLESLSRAVDFSSCEVDPTVSFRYREFVSAASETLTFDYTEDGTNYVTVATFANTGASQPYFSFSGTVPQTAIEIRFSVSSVGGSEFFAVDDVVLSCFETTPAVTTTDADGYYSFDSTDGLQAEDDYQLCVDLSQSALSDFSLTGQDTGGVTSNDPSLDDNDSDAAQNGSNQAIIVFTAPESGQTNEGYDFGFGRLAIGNYVWNDVDGDGLQDSDEPGIAGVEVKLLDEFGAPVTVSSGVDYQDDFETSSTSGTSGGDDWSGTPWVQAGGASFVTDVGDVSYQLAGSSTSNTVAEAQVSRPVDLTACVDTPNVPFSFDVRGTPDGGSGNFSDRMLVEYSTDNGTNYTTILTCNNGNVNGTYQSSDVVAGSPLTIPNTSTHIRFSVFSLENGDVFWIDNVVVSCSEVVDAVATTDMDGFYEFTSSDGLQALTDYELCVDMSQDELSGLVLTDANASGETSNEPLGDDVDSDAMENGSNQAIISLTSPATGNENPGYDFGFAQTKLGNFVWRDLDKDGLQDAGEPGIDGVTVALLNPDGSPAMAVTGVEYEDDFESSSTSGSSGNTDWSQTPWVQSGGASFVTDGGDISYQLTGSNTSNTVAEAEITRPVDITACATTSNVPFSFDVRGTLSGGTGTFSDRMDVQYSTDGGTSYTTIVTYNAGNVTSSYQSSDVLVSGPLTIPNTATHIRFSVFSLENAETFWIDNISISCSGAVAIVTTTANGGEYCFTSQDGLQPDTNYIIEIDEGQAPLTNLGLTGTNSGLELSNDPTGDDSDSDAENISNLGFARIAVTSPSAGEVNLSYDFGFVEVKATNFLAWQTQNPLGGSNGPLQDGDNDGTLNLVEYALCLKADSGLKVFPDGTNPNNGFEIVHNETTGLLDACYSRPVGAIDLSYELLESSDGTSWSPVPLGTIAPTISSSGDIEKVTYSDLEGNMGTEGLLLVRVTLNGVATDDSANTSVVGWQTHTFEEQCETYADPFLGICYFTGAGTVSDNTVDLTTSLGGGDLTTVLTSSSGYYIEVMSGDFCGHRFDIASVTATSITLATDSDLFASSPCNTLLTIPDFSGDTIVISEYPTLNELFPPELFLAGTNAATGDNVLFFDRITQALTTFYLLDDVGGDKWVMTGSSNDLGNTPVCPAEGLFTHHRDAAFDVVQFGAVREWKSVVPLKAGYNLVPSMYPIDTSAADRVMDEATGFTGTGDPSTADQYITWRGDTVAGHECYDGFFYTKIGSFDQWTSAGDVTLSDISSRDDFLSDRSAFYCVQNPSGNPTFAIPSPIIPPAVISLPN